MEMRTENMEKRSMDGGKGRVVQLGMGESYNSMLWVVQLKVLSRTTQSSESYNSAS